METTNANLATRNMIKEILGAVLSALAIITLLIVGIFYVPQPKLRVYDCGMAEWHPDIPTKVKEECRLLRSNGKTI